MRPENLIRLELSILVQQLYEARSALSNELKRNGIRELQDSEKEFANNYARALGSGNTQEAEQHKRTKAEIHQNLETKIELLSSNKIYQDLKQTINNYEKKIQEHIIQLKQNFRNYHNSNEADIALTIRRNLKEQAFLQAALTHVLGAFKIKNATKKKPLHLQLQALTIQQLVIAYNYYLQPNTHPQAATITTVLKDIALEVINEFSKEKVWPKELLQIIIPLAACQQRDIQYFLLNRLATRLKRSPLLDPNLVQSIANFIRYALPVPTPTISDNNNATNDNNQTPINFIKEELYETLKVIFSKLQTIQPDSTEKLKALLEAISVIYNVMIDQGITSLPADLAQQQYAVLKDYAQDSNAEIQYLGQYAIHALSWLPNDESPFLKYLGCSFNIVSDALQVGSSILNMNPVDFVNNAIALAQSTNQFIDTVGRNWKEERSFYVQLRFLEPFFKPDLGSLVKLEKLLETMRINPTKAFLMGFLTECRKLLITPKFIVSQKIILILIRLSGVGPNVLTRQYPDSANLTSQAGRRFSTSVDFSIYNWLKKQSRPLLVGLTEDQSRLCQESVLRFLRLVQRQAFSWLSNAEDPVLLRFIENTILALEQQLSASNNNSFSLLRLFKKTIPSTVVNNNVQDSMAEENNNQSITTIISSLEKDLIMRAYRKRRPMLYRLEQMAQKIKANFEAEDFLEDLRFYIDLKATTNENLIVELETKLNEICKSAFSTDNQNAVILIQGPSGCGKTLFTRYFLQKKWQTFSLFDDTTVLPLFVSLSRAKNPSHKLMEQALEFLGCSTEEITTFKKTRRFIVVLDAVDEVQTKNIYKTNALHEWNAVYIVTSQVGYASEDKHDWRSDNGVKLNSFTKFDVAPFTETEIKNYLTKRSDHASTKEVPSYQTIMNLSGINQLITSPFILKIIVEAWPNISATLLQNPNRETDKKALYDTFIASLYQEAYNEFLRKGQIPSGFKFYESLQTYGEELAIEMWSARQLIVPVLANRFLTEQEIKHSPWSRFFTNTFEARLGAKGVPLKFSNGRETAQFIHASIYEHYVCMALIREILFLRDLINEGKIEKVAKSLNANSRMNRQTFINDEAILNFLKAQLTNDGAAIEALILMVKYSAKDPDCHVMAANAISLLVYMKVSLYDCNFSQVDIRNANLSDGLLQNVKFVRANLTNVNFTRAWLDKVDFTGADLSNAEFDERPYLKYQEPINTICYSPDKKLLVAAAKDIFYINDKKIELQSKDNKKLKITAIMFMGSEQLVLGTDIGSVFVMNLKTDLITEFNKYHHSGVQSLAYYSKNSFISAGGKTIKKWEFSYNWLVSMFTSEPIVTFSYVTMPQGITEPHGLVYYSENDCLAYIGSNLQKSKELILVKNNLSVSSTFIDSSEIYQFQMLPQRNLILVAKGYAIVFYNLETKQEMTSIYNRSRKIAKFTLNPAESHLFVYGTALEVWNLPRNLNTTMQCIERYSNNVDFIKSLAFNAKGVAFLLNRQGFIEQFHSKPKSDSLTHSNKVPITALLIDPLQPDIAYSLDEHCNLVKWNLANGENKILVYYAENKPVQYSKINKPLFFVDENTIGFYDRYHLHQIKIFNLITQEVTAINIHSPIKFIASSNSRDKFAVITIDESEDSSNNNQPQNVTIYQYTSIGATFDKQKMKASRGVTAIAFDPNEKLVGAHEHIEHLLSEQSTPSEPSFKVESKETITNLGFNQKGYLVSFSAKAIKIWYYSSNICKREINFASEQDFVSVAFGPNNLIAFTNKNGDVTLVNDETGETFFTGNLGFAVLALAFHPNGDLITGGSDCAVKRWQLDFNSKELKLIFNTNKRLYLQNAKVEGVQNITEEQRAMFAQRKAIGHPATVVTDKNREAKAASITYPRTYSFVATIGGTPSPSVSNNNNISSDIVSDDVWFGF